MKLTEEQKKMLKEREDLTAWAEEALGGEAGARRTGAAG